MAEARGHIRVRNGKLEAVIYGLDGKRVTRSTGCAPDQRAEAEEILRLALEQINGVAVPATTSGPLTLKAWGEAWIEDRKARGKLEWIYEKGHLENYVYRTLGHRALASITTDDMLDWARGLSRTRGPSGKAPGPKYVRRITATVRAMFKEALKRKRDTGVTSTPCIWDNTDLPELEANSRVIGEGFEVGDVARLITDPRVPEDRRVLYALEFLTGMRTGEAAARRWKDWEPVFLGHLGRLTAATAYSTRHRLVKTTKTRVEKWIPVHPALEALLTWWKREGFERYTGRVPEPEDIIVPAAKGGIRNNSCSWRLFQKDLVVLGMEHQRHYDTRAAFISMAEGAGADPVQVSRITHASQNSAKDLYRRVRLYWPLMCKAVECIKLPAGEGEEATAGDCAGRCAEPAEVPAETAETLSQIGIFSQTGKSGRARESNPPAAPFSTTHRF